MTIKKAYLLGLLFLLVFTGCGGSNVSTLSSGVVGGEDVVFGRVLLDKPAAGATAQLTDLSGVPLGYPPAEVDETGNFRIQTNIAALPPEFRVSVRLDGSSPWDLPIVADVRDYNEDKSVFCNILTTAAALYRQRKGVTAEEAAIWVRGIFDIPSGVDIGWGLDESTRSAFRHSVFLTEMAGGSVAGRIDALIENGPVTGQILTTLAITLVADLATDAIGEVAGSVAQALGLNIGDDDEVTDLSKELSDIQSQIDRLSSQLQTDFNQLETAIAFETLVDEYTDLTISLEDTISGIEVATQDLATEATESDITNEPFSPDSDLTDLLSQIAAYDAESDIRILVDTLLGRNQSPSLLKIYLEILAYQSVPPLIDTGTSPAPVFASTPVLSNTLIFDRFERLSDYYFLIQTLALNLLVENANLSQDQATVEEARDTATALSHALVEQYWERGFPLDSDFYLANPQAAFEGRGKEPLPSTPSGTLFYTQIQAPVVGYPNFNDDGQALIDQAESFQAPGYPSGWRLASLDELQQLRALALQANPDNVINGLALLGFSTAGWEGDLWFPDYDQPGVDGLSGNYFLKVYDFIDGVAGGYESVIFETDLLGAEISYIQVNYLPFDSSQTYEHIVASGFRPTTAPQLTLSPDGTAVTATLNGEDISQYTVWTSSNPEQLEVDNLGEDSGTLTWHPGAGPLAAQTITATIQGMDSATGQSRQLQATLSVPVPSPAPVRELTRIVISPSNLIVDDTSADIPFTATAYYDDRTLQDVTGQVSWELLLPDGSPYPIFEASINGSIPGILIFISPIINNPEFTVQATLDDVVGTTQVEVATP